MCMIEGADGMWETLTDEPRKARKAHRCHECGREIQSGETYHYTFAISEGAPYTVKQCAHCRASARWLEIVCRGWLYEGITEDLEQHFTEEPPPIRSLDLGRLLVWRSRRWKGVTPERVREVAERGGTRTMALLVPEVPS